MNHRLDKRNRKWKQRFLALWASNQKPSIYSVTSLLDPKKFREISVGRFPEGQRTKDARWLVRSGLFSAGLEQPIWRRFGRDPDEELRGTF